MQKTNPHWPFRRVIRRIGASPEFAKAMARAEFGRFYTDDNREQEVRRSITRAKTRQPAARAAEPPPAKPERSHEKRKPLVSRPPCLKERRSELAEGINQLREGAKRR